MINKIKFTNLEALVYCNSEFYRALDSCECYGNEFSSGINFLSGEIDSGIWGVSYILSMYMQSPKDIILYSVPNITVNNASVSLSDISKTSCYMDKSYELFSSKMSVKKIVSKGLKKSKLSYTPKDILSIFDIDSVRFERPITQVGNQLFRCMAAIGFVYNKQIFCFPWMSKKRFEYYHENITEVLNVLESLNKMVIVPIGIN